MSRCELTRLADCCEIVSGATPSTLVDRYWGGPIAWATPKDLSDLDSKYLAATPDTLTDEGYRSCSTQLLPPGSVLLSSRAPIGHVAINTVPMCTNQGFKSLVPDATRVSSDYLYHWVKANKLYLQSLGNGATFKEVSKAVISEVKVPLPPLPEQRRIAAILDKADALRAKRREAIAKLDQLLQSVFLDMFGDPVTNPKRWPTVPLREFGKVTTGNTPPRAVADNYGDGIEWIKSDNLNTPSDYLTTAEERLSISGERVARIAPPGSVLITCIAGSLNCIGNLAIADRRVAFNQQINSVTPRDAPVEFLYSLLKVAKPLIQGASTNSMKGMVSKSKLEAIVLPKPPNLLQREFARRFAALRVLREKADRAVRDSSALFEAAQQRAFSGQL